MISNVQCINKGHSHSPAVMPLLKRFIWTAAHKQLIITAKHVPGVKNLIADSLIFLFRNSGSLHHKWSHIPSLFRADMETSISLFLQAVTPRTLLTYLTTCKSLKKFHTLYNISFPDFSLLPITSFFLTYTL